MDVTWTEVTLRKNKVSDPADAFNQMKADEAAFGERKQMLPPAETTYAVEEGYWGAHVDHFMHFFEGVKNGTPVAEDAVFGLRAAAPALACNTSLYDQRVVRWNPVSMEVVD